MVFGKSLIPLPTSTPTLLRFSSSSFEAGVVFKCMSFEMTASLENKGRTWRIVPTERDSKFLTGSGDVQATIIAQQQSGQQGRQYESGADAWVTVCMCRDESRQRGGLEHIRIAITRFFNNILTKEIPYLIGFSIIIILFS